MQLHLVEVKNAFMLYIKWTQHAKKRKNNFSSVPLPLCPVDTIRLIQVLNQCLRNKNPTSNHLNYVTDRTNCANMKSVAGMTGHIEIWRWFFYLHNTSVKCLPTSAKYPSIPYNYCYCVSVKFIVNYCVCSNHSLLKVNCSVLQQEVRISGLLTQGFSTFLILINSAWKNSFKATSIAGRRRIQNAVSPKPSRGAMQT